MRLLEIVKELSIQGVITSLQYDVEREQFSIDLNTQAKSDLYLYEDGIIRGRYEYENHLVLSDNMEELIKILCWEFDNALHGRNFGNEDWFELCKINNVKVTVYGK